MKNVIGEVSPFHRVIQRSLLRSGELFTILILIAAARGAFAATYYVDGGCPNNGNGLASGCAAATGGTGAFVNLQTGLNALSSPGDILNIAGPHGTFDGVYSADSFSISGKNGSSSSPIIIQPQGYPSAPATVYIESTVSASWTQCNSASCTGAPVLSETWFTTKSGDGSNRVYWARKPDGSITPRKASLTALTSQYDAYSCEGCSTLYVRWGPSLPSKPNINYANNGNGFVLSNVSYVTIRGLVFRDMIRSSIQVNYPNTNVTIDSNKFWYVNDSQNGSGRPVLVDSPVNVQIINNEFAWSSSEPIHITEQSSGRVSGLIKGNWIHDIGDRQKLGPATGGTPNCTTFTSDAPLATNTTGDFSGLTVDGNLFENCYDSTAILFESHCDGMTVSNNIIRGVPLAFKWSPDNGGSANHTSGNRVYNNLIYGLVTGSHNGAGDCFLMTGSSAIKNNVISNNTCADIVNLGVESQAGSNTSGNQVANSIFVRPGGGAVVNAAQPTTFQNNLVWNGSTSGGVGTISGSTVSCGDSANRCGDPKFASASTGDYHLGVSSPAIGGAINTILQALRLSDICNAAGPLPHPYSDCQALSGAWDIGMDEYGGTSVATASIKVGNLNTQYVPAGSYTILVNTSASVSAIPGPMTLTESDGSTVPITLVGSIPGTSFTGSLSVNSSVADGSASFTLPTGSLLTITSVNGIPGSTIIVDKTPPASPVNLRPGN